MTFTDDEKRQLIDKIQIWRFDNRKPVKFISEKLGVSITNVSRWERGTQLPTVKHCYYITKFLKENNVA